MEEPKFRIFDKDNDPTLTAFTLTQLHNTVTLREVKNESGETVYIPNPHGLVNLTRNLVRLLYKRGDIGMLDLVTLYGIEFPSGGRIALDTEAAAERALELEVERKTQQEVADALAAKSQGGGDLEEEDEPPRSVSIEEALAGTKKVEVDPDDAPGLPYTVAKAQWEVNGRTRWAELNVPTQVQDLVKNYSWQIFRDETAFSVQRDGQVEDQIAVAASAPDLLQAMQMAYVQERLLAFDGRRDFADGYYRPEHLPSLEIEFQHVQ